MERVTQLEHRRELREARREADILRRALQDLLHGPFTGMGNWARTTACAVLGHPARPDREHCVCGGSKW
jgi:hypothetical protein